MKLPDWREWLYSLKAFAAAMLALYLALSLSLPNPYWSVATVYIVSHPLSGTTHSKAIYRVAGTLIGAAASVALVPVFVETPVAMCLVTALWVGTLLYLALLNPSPSGYVFMLAAYTMPLISMPTLARPDQIFNVALARSEEILLGIVCASFVNTLVFPRRIGPILGARMSQLLGDAATWSAARLDPARGNEATPDLRHRLIGDIAALDAMIRQMGYDSIDREQGGRARQIRLRMLMLVPQVSALTDPLAVLRRRNEAAFRPVAELVAETVAWMSARRGPEQADGLRAKVQASSDVAAGDDIDRAVARNALLRLSELIDLWQDCLYLQASYQQGGGVARLRYRTGRLSDRVRHYDHGLLLFASASTAAATFVAAMLWVASGWPMGSGGVLLIAVACCFFAAPDDPMPLLNRFLVWVVVGSAFALIYLFAILPQVQTYAGLVMVLAPCLLFAGAFTGHPQHNTTVLLFTSQAISDLGLRGAYAANFESFANSSLSAILGIVYVLLWTAITRPFGTEQIAGRLARASWRDLTALATSRSGVDHARLTSRMVDRTSQLLPRVALLKDRPLARLDAVRDLRICLRLFELTVEREHLPRPVAGLVDRALAEVAAYYQACTDAGVALEPSQALRARLGELVRGVLLERPSWQADRASVDRASQALMSLYLALVRSGPQTDDADEGAAPLLPSPAAS